MTRPRLDTDAVYRALMSRTVETDNGCWEYQGSRDEKGYGRYAGPRWLTTRLAHRISWILTNGHPGEKCVLHRCDNPPCIRPSHLFLGTIADNNADMKAKGRKAQFAGFQGEAHPRAKLTKGDIAAIRAASRHGAMQSELARAYGVSKSHIWRIINHISWASEPR